MTNIGLDIISTGPRPVFPPAAAIVSSRENPWIDSLGAAGGGFRAGGKLTDHPWEVDACHLGVLSDFCWMFNLFPQPFVVLHSSLLFSSTSATISQSKYGMAHDSDNGRHPAGQFLWVPYPNRLQPSLPDQQASQARCGGLIWIYM